ncbi:MAG: sigma-70 family RNA polymerase sigma factor [Labilithrix sp.]|nr:sigma-70 family RNA polymerase sigma factor [Labilithrix sp.]MCW5813513.1 sigma-70 family RNA polymerase sigma factor [Labilithrix sp.]
MAASTHLPKLLVSEAALSAVPCFDDVYRDHFAFVWRSAKRLGVRDGSLDDVVQEVFVIVHRRLDEFEGRSSLRTWLFGITLRVARDHRRSLARKSPAGSVDPDSLRATTPGPSESMERAEAIALLHALLDELDDDKREVFVMAQLEQMTMPDIASTLGLNVNTAYARLRAARLSFEDALARHRAREAHPSLPSSSRGGRR